MIRFYLVLLGGILALVWGVLFLDWLGRRQQRRNQRPSR
jgi:hypothetical protein